MKYQVGIDLGTSNTVCCWIEDGKERYVQFFGKDTLPSLLFVEEGQKLVGEKAKRKGLQKPRQLIRSAKTHMGDLEWSQEIEGVAFNATDVATEVLAHVREEFIASLKLADDVEIEAVITVPAYFKANQREETKKAGEQAGLVVKSIIQEPVAAAIAATSENVLKERLFVIDLGGGTFDVSILTYGYKNAGGYDIEMIEGDSRLGGDNFDEKIIEWIYTKILSETGFDLADDSCPVAGLDKIRSRIHALAETTKVKLSNQPEASVKLANLFMRGTGELYSLDTVMTREVFEEECSRLFKKIERTIKKALVDAKLEPTQIDRVLLVGGSSQIPKIQDISREIFSKEPSKNQDLSRIVALGAALYGTEQKGMVEMVLPHSLGVEVTRDGVEGKMQIMLPRLEKYPLTVEKEFTTSIDYQEAIIINVFEGEHDDTKDNEFYGTLLLEGIEKAKKRVPKINITFAFDKDGILTVSAKDLKTNVEMTQQVTIDKSLSKPKPQQAMDIALLIDASGSMRDDDKIGKAISAARNLVEHELDLQANKVAVCAFTEQLKVVQKFTNDEKKLIESFKQIKAYGGTHLGPTFRMLLDLFDDNTGRAKCAILVTDGRTTNETAAFNQAERLRENNIRVIAIGVGRDMRMEYLEKIAAQESDCYTIDSMDELKDVFAKVSSTLQLA